MESRAPHERVVRPGGPDGRVATARSNPIDTDTRRSGSVVVAGRPVVPVSEAPGNAIQALPAYQSLAWSIEDSGVHGIDIRSAYSSWRRLYN